MTNKTLAVAVSCVNEWAENMPSVLIVTLTPEAVERILKLQAAVKALGVHSIEEFDGSPTYYTEHDVQLTLGEAKIKAVSDGEGGEVDVECAMLKVTDTCFSFHAVPDHLGDDNLCRSSDIPIQALLDDPAPVAFYGL